MGRFNRGGGGGKRFGGRSGGGKRFGGRDNRGSQMYETVCDNCGKNCEVPFRPSGDKPVYCSDCFEEFGERDRRDGGFKRNDFGSSRDNRESRGSNGITREQYETLNNKLDQILKVLSKVVPRDTGEVDQNTGDNIYEFAERKTVRAEEE